MSDKRGININGNLPEVFRRIHYHLYANSNILRSERLGIEMVRILYCKIFDEMNNGTDFMIKNGENVEQVGYRIRELFSKVVLNYPDVFSIDESIGLDNKSIYFVVETLQYYFLNKTPRDVIAEAFQAFWGHGLRGEKGQFFTPRNVVKMCVDVLAPKPGEKIIDPACGSGGFLVEIYSSLGIKNYLRIFGIDKEPDLVKISKAYMAMIGDGHANIFNLDSLYPESWPQETKKILCDDSFDVVLTNPPFGAKIFIDDKKILKNFELGYKWLSNENGWYRNKDLQKQVPQILFIERCIQLLKQNGRMAIVLPDGLFGNSSDRYVWEYIKSKTQIIGIVSLPPEAFLPSTHTKTSVLFLKKITGKMKDYPIFMAIAKKIGHDKNGKLIYKMTNDGKPILDQNGDLLVDDDLPEITENFLVWLRSNNILI